MPGVKISDLPLATLQGPDIFPVARAGITLGVRASDILNRFISNETSMGDLSSRTISVIDSPTIDLTYNSTTRYLSADLQPVLDLRDRTVYMPLTAEIPPGTVMSFLGKTAPPGWLLCNGDIVPNGIAPVQGINTNFSRLWTVVGTTYGATPGTLPDLRGYFIRGYGSSSDPSVGANADGTESGAFGQKETDTFQGHKHGIYDPTHGHTGSADPSGNHSHNYQVSTDTGQFMADGGGGGFITDTGSANVNGTLGTASEGYGNQIGKPSLGPSIDANGNHTHTVTVNPNSTGVKVLSPTGDQATLGSGDSNGPGGITTRVGFETKPKNIALLWCVKY
jgi:microcystin-dependent protein